MGSRHLLAEETLVPKLHLAQTWTSMDAASPHVAVSFHISLEQTGILLSYSSGRCPSHVITKLAMTLALTFSLRSHDGIDLVGIVNSLVVRPFC